MVGGKVLGRFVSRAEPQDECGFNMVKRFAPLTVTCEVSSISLTCLLRKRSNKHNSTLAWNAEKCHLFLGLSISHGASSSVRQGPEEEVEAGSWIVVQCEWCIGLSVI